MTNFSPSARLTMGVALDRAEGRTVTVRADGADFTGVVAYRDAEGLVLEADFGEMAVIRMADISAVRLARTVAYPDSTEQPRLTTVNLPVRV